MIFGKSNIPDHGNGTEHAVVLAVKVNMGCQARALIRTEHYWGECIHLYTGMIIIAGRLDLPQTILSLNAKTGHKPFRKQAENIINVKLF